MKSNVMRERLLASSMICGVMALGLTPAQALAQAAGGGQGQVSEVVVTGSRIPQPNLSSVSPIQVVTDREIKLQGKTDVVDLMNNLPQNFQNAAADFSGNSNPLSAPGGVSTADLRGLGPQRTLVLVDGRRLGVGDANSGNPNPAPDLNQIPAGLVDRVEVLTGGASATYGSDAVAGVVNFVMKHNFEGVQIDGQFGMAQHNQHDSSLQALGKAFHIDEPKDAWDGRTRDLSLIIGGNNADSNANITAYFTLHDQDPVSDRSRDWSACQVAVTANVPRCTGSANSNQYFVGEGGGALAGLQQTGFAVSGNQFVDWTKAPGDISPPLRFNANPYQYLQHQDTRYSAGFFSHYDVSKSLSLYGDFSYMLDRATTQVAPSGLFEGSGPSPNAGFLVNCNNPLLSSQQALAICSPAEIASGANADLSIGRRNIEGGGRQSKYRHENFRAVVGAKGDVPDFDGWQYDIFGSYYYTSLYQANLNYLSTDKIQRALQVVNVNGVPTCVAKVTGLDAGCVPYNIFTTGGVTPEQLNYLYAPGTSSGEVRESIVQANLTGDLGRYGVTSPWAHDGAAVALGLEHRRDVEDYEPDAAELSNTLEGFSGAATPIHAALGVTEGYGELRLPLVQDAPYIQDLSFDGGFRHSHYTTGTNANTYKVAFSYTPVDDVRFRGSFQRAIRAPNIIELYSAQSVTQSQALTEDACAPNNGVAATATLAQCERTGITAAQYGNGLSTSNLQQCPASQCSVQVGGNPDLKAERSNTYSVGMTVQPRFLRGFTGSVDYYRIKIAGEIGTIGPDVVFANCLQTGDPVYCSQVHRGANGILFGTGANAGYVSSLNVNVASVRQEGIDVQGTYRAHLEDFGLDDYGAVSVQFIGTALLKAETTPMAGADTYDCAGLFGSVCQTVNPKWRHTLRLTWEAPHDLLLSAAWRYIGEVKYEANTSQPTLGNGKYDAYDAKMPAVSYLDLSAIWKVTPGLTLRAGMNNVFDKDPPILASAIPGSGLPNAYPTYDFLGRTMFIGFTGTF